MIPLFPVSSRLRSFQRLGEVTHAVMLLRRSCVSGGQSGHLFSAPGKWGVPIGTRGLTLGMCGLSPIYCWFLRHTVWPHGAPGQGGCQVKNVAVFGEMYILDSPRTTHPTTTPPTHAREGGKGRGVGGWEAPRSRWRENISRGVCWSLDRGRASQLLWDRPAPTGAVRRDVNFTPRRADAGQARGFPIPGRLAPRGARGTRSRPAYAPRPTLGR